MASSHIARITAGGVSDRRIAHSLYGYCNTAATTTAKTVSLYTGSGTTADGTWAAADIFPGLTIKVKFQYSNVASSPTLNVNGSGAKPIYRYGSFSVGKGEIDSWFGGQIVTLTYDTSSISTGCWLITRGYRVDTYDRMTLSNETIKIGNLPIEASDSIIVASTAGLYHPLKSGAAFDITYPILCTSAMVDANTTTSNVYIDKPFSIYQTQNTIVLDPHKAIYIKGHLNGTVFTPVSTAPLTQTIPSTADTYQYMLLGYARATSPYAYLLRDHPIFEYSGGKFHQHGDNGVGVFHTTIAKTANLSNNISVSHYLNTKNIMVSVIVYDGTNEYMISPTSVSFDTGIAYTVKVLSNDGVLLVFNPNQSWSNLVGSLKVTVITTDAFTIDPASTNDILIKVN